MAAVHIPMIATLACLFAIGMVDPDEITVVSGTVWSISYSRGKPQRVRIYGLQESSQPEIRRKARLVSHKYVLEYKDLGLDIGRIGNTNSDPLPVEVSYTTWSGDLSYREQNTRTFGNQLLGEGLAKIYPKDFREIGNKAHGGQLAYVQEMARVRRKGMWAIKVPD
ncbi:MAG: hypothetical protein H7Y17_04950 [Chlorobia bacterium]|nr:hypothetical protein [Fimbriimonadaceae bacterium]